MSSLTRCLVTVLGLATAAGMWADYLPRVGPAPLRFGSVTRVAGTNVVLPPLAMADAPPAHPPEASGPKATLAETNRPSPVVAERGGDLWGVLLAAPGSSEPRPPLAPAPDPAPPPTPTPPPVDLGNGGLTPQMLLTLFDLSAGRTNKPGTTIVLPGSLFQPPIAAPVPSSSATYSTP
jgi:hypothetical protein